MFGKPDEDLGSSLGGAVIELALLCINKLRWDLVVQVLRLSIVSSTGFYDTYH